MTQTVFKDSFLKIPSELSQNEGADTVLVYGLLQSMKGYHVSAIPFNIPMFMSIIKSNKKTLKVKLANALNKLIEIGYIKVYSDMQMRNQIDEVTFPHADTSFFIDIIDIQFNHFSKVETLVFVERILPSGKFDEVAKVFMLYCVITSTMFNDIDDIKVSSITKKKLSDLTGFAQKTVKRYVDLLINLDILGGREIEMTNRDGSMSNRIIYSSIKNKTKLKKADYKKLCYIAFPQMYDYFSQL